MAKHGLKRIHLFEFEDFSWFPSWLRECMTRYLMTMHKLLGTEAVLAELLANLLKNSREKRIIDLCSGSGGPMPNVATILKKQYGFQNLKLTLSDLYPHQKAIQIISKQNNPQLTYHTEAIDASHLEANMNGMRTMICSLHHMKPETVKAILRDAMEAGQPFCALEISDNSYPKAIWWLTIPFNFITALFVTLMVRPMSWQQLVFTYLIPIIPLMIAWDGAVSNARTYTVDDLDIILTGLRSENYTWETGIIKGKGNKLYLTGIPN